MIVIWTTLGIIFPAAAQTLGVTYTGELQYSPTTHRANFCNLLRTDWNILVYKNGEFNASTLHFYKVNPMCVLEDELTFSNIEETNNPFALALLGYTQNIWKSTLFLGVRNMNEDYFNSPLTSFFTNSSCGIFPTISTNYPIANYPLSGLCFHYTGQFNRLRVKGSLYNGAGYNGWSKEDNPFIIDFKNDGIFGITEINYESDYGLYLCGISAHSNVAMYREWRCEATQTTQKKTDFIWWLYAEQQLFERSGHQINLLLQYSENGYKNSYCNRYGGLGMLWAFQDNKANQHSLGLVATGAEFDKNYEVDFEITYSYQIKKGFCVQPVIHLVKDKREFNTVFSFRFLYAIQCRGGRAYKVLAEEYYL